MTTEKVGMTEEELLQVRDRPLEESYEDHDVGYEIITSRLKAHGLTYEDHGDDNRHSDEVIYGDGPDLEIKQDGETVAYIEIKVKTDPEWFGRCNVRHLREYVNFHNETDVPVFIWFCYVKEDTNVEDSSDDESSAQRRSSGTPRVVHREAFVEITDMDQIEGDVVDVRDEEVVFDEEDVDHVNDNGLRKLAGTDAINVDPSDTIVDFIPDVFGNDVVQLNDREYRSWPHFLHRIS